MTWVFGGMTAAELAASGLAAGTAAGGTAAGIGAGAGAGLAGGALAGGGLAAAEAAPAIGGGAASLLPEMPALAEMPAGALPAAGGFAEGGLPGMYPGINAVGGEWAPSFLQNTSVLPSQTALEPMQALPSMGPGMDTAGLQIPGMSSKLPGMNLPGANPMEPPGLDSLPNPMALFGGGESAPPPMPKPVMPQPVGSPPTPKMSQSMLNKDNMKTAHSALRMASKLVTNKKDKQTLGLMSLTTGLAANGGDMSNMGDMMSGPLADIAAGTQEAQPQQQPQQPKRLSDLRAPSTQQQPGPIAKAIPWLPPTKLYG